MNCFTPDNLENIIINHPGMDISMDPQVKEFLIDAANDFIRNSIEKTAELKRMKSDGKLGEDPIDDPESMKFAMLNIYDVDVCLKKESEIRKNKKIRRDNKKRISLKLAESSYYG